MLKSSQSYCINIDSPGNWTRANSIKCHTHFATYFVCHQTELLCKTDRPPHHPLSSVSWGQNNNLHCFLGGQCGRSVWPLGVADDARDPVLWRHFECGEHVQVWAGQKEAYEPDDARNTQRGPFAHARTQGIHNGHVPGREGHAMRQGAWNGTKWYFRSIFNSTREQVFSANRIHVTLMRSQ